MVFCGIYMKIITNQSIRAYLKKNDLFFIIFALPSSLSIYVGLEQKIYFLAAIGFGIMLYGAAYFVVHDVLIH